MTDWTKSADGIRKFYARRRERAAREHEELMRKINREEDGMLAALPMEARRG